MVLQVLLCCEVPPLDSCIEQIGDGGYVINAIVLEASTEPLCVVNVFLPTGYL